MAIYDENSNQHSDGSDSVAHQPMYYNVHVFFSRSEGYSIPVKISNPDITSDEDIIQYCEENELFTEAGDGQYVDTVDEIDLAEYKLMKA